MQTTVLPQSRTTIFSLSGLAVVAIGLLAWGASAMLLGILGLIAAIGIMSWKPQIGLYAMCFLLPVIGWEFSIAGLYFTPIDLVALLAVFGLFTRAVWTRVFGHNPQPLRWPLFVPFAVFFAIVILSSLINDGQLGNLWYAIRVVIFLYFAYIVLPVSVIEDKRQLRLALIWITVSAAIMTLLSLATLYGQYIEAEFFRVRGIQLFGIYPFGFNHNLIAEYLIMGNFCLLALKYWLPAGPARRLVTIGFIVMTIAALGTFSRAAWVATGIQLAVYFFLRKTNRVKLLIATLALAVFFTPLVIKMSELQSNNASSTASRVLLTEIAVASVKEKPFLGYGAGNFIDLIRSNIRFNAQYGEPLESHGVLQKVATEHGLIGLAAFLVVVVMIFQKLFNRALMDGPYRDLILPLAVSGLGGFIFQLFNTSYYKGKLWLPIGLGLVAIYLAASKKHRHADAV